MIELFKKVLQAEAEAINSIVLDSNIEDIVKKLASCSGKILTTGIGKAGYIARKAASTFSTTGSPAVFLHPGDASHGDIGVVSDLDILLAFSNSGKTREVIETVSFCKLLGINSTITICKDKNNPLGEQSDLVLTIGKIKEPCPLGMTPTASTTAMMAIADALAITVMQEKGFTKEDFAMRHHGGYLGIKTKNARKTRLRESAETIP